MADKTRRSLFWNAALYYGVLIALLLVLVGVIQPSNKVKPAENCGSFA